MDTKSTDARRVKILMLSQQLLIDILNLSPAGFSFVQLSGADIPADAEIVRVQTNFERGTIDALIWSATFPIALDGCELERLPEPRSIVKRTSSSLIRVWPFWHAPAQYSELSEHGGNEDWLAFVPAALADCWIGWLEPGSPFGVCDVSKHEVEGGTVHIGAHS